MITEKTMTALQDVPIGTTFELWGKKFTVLKQDEDKVFVIAAEFATTMPFRKEDGYIKDQRTNTPPNDFRKSDIKSFLNGEYIDKLVVAGANVERDIAPLTVSLKCTMGQHEYDADTVLVGLLTLEQYGEFYNIIPLIESNRWYLATPWKTPSLSPYVHSTDFIWSVFPNRCIGETDCIDPLGVRPVLNLNPYLPVTWEIEKSKSLWQDYILYLYNWTAEHSDCEFAGCSPACYQEWLDCENEEEEDN